MLQEREEEEDEEEEGRRIEAELAEKLEGAFDDLDLGKAIILPCIPLSFSVCLFPSPSHIFYTNAV